MVGSARFWERVLGGSAAAAVRRPWATVALALGLTLACGALAAWRLELKSSNLDLVDPDLPEVARFRSFASAFGTPNLLVVVFEGTEPAALARAAERASAAIVPLDGVRTVWARLPFRDDLLLPLGVDPYFRSKDGGMLFLFAQPSDADSAATTIAPFVAGVRRAVASLGLGRERIRVGYTGLPQYALDDRDVIQRDVTRLSGISFVAILLLFAWSFRGVREPALAMLVLGAGAVVTAGVAAFLPGHLTLVSAFFFSILFGLGIDFGVHVVDRAEELRADGTTNGAALVAAVRSLAPGLGTGAATTALSFLILLVSGFRGFAELGGLAGFGVIATLFGMITLLPALLVLVPGRSGAQPPRRRSNALLLAAARPAVAWTLLALVAAATIAVALSPPRFDGDYLKLQPARSEAVRLEREMVARSDGAAQFAAFVAPDAAAAQRLTERLRSEPTVAAVRSAADYEALLALGAEMPDEWARFRALYVDARGRQAVYAFPKGDVWEPGFQARFTGAMRAIDPEVTGMPFLGRFLVELSRRALWITGLLSAAMLVLLVAADFTNPWRAALAVGPTFGAVVTMAAGMRLLGVDFNPLNILALPIVLGVAEDSGVHLVHRFLVEEGDLGRTLAGTGRTIFVCGATTLVGFGALAFADHRGLASFAIALSLGVGSALALSLFLLPQLLRWLAPRILERRRSELSSRAPAVAGKSAALLAAFVLIAGGARGGDASPGATTGAEARATNCWRERGRGFATTGRIDPEPARCALESWSEAHRAEPARLDLAFREIEALWFAAHFAAADGAEARTWLDRAVIVADGALSDVDRKAVMKTSDGEDSLESRARRLRALPEAGEAEFWAAIAWGEWAVAHGGLVAVTHGAIGKMHNAAELAALLAPGLREGGGLRLLGRIHATAPRVPLVTGWVDRERGLELLRSAVALSTRDPRNPFFLAEALLDQRPAERETAVTLLREVAARTPDPDELVEQSETVSAARARLAALEGDG